MTWNRKPTDGLPVLRGFISLDRCHIRVHCPCCDKMHEHTWEPDAPDWSISHRVAHCLPGSPWRDGGYYVGPFTKAQLPS